MTAHSRKRNRSSSFRVKPRLLTFESRIAPAVFTVLNANDTGAGSLRDALTQANATVASDIINFDPAFFSTPRTIALATSLTVSQDVSIVGPGAANLTVNGGGAVRDFFIEVDGKAGNVTLSGMTITGGFVAATAIGGGIFTDDNTVIDSCIITGNTAGAGGGVTTSNYGQLTIRNSTVSSNTANGAATIGGGGGIRIGQFGSARISNTSVTGNTGPIGGGISLQANNTMVLENSTISGNTATGAGGAGLYTLGTPGSFYINPSSTIVINNSTFANNTATTGAGGGIMVAGTAGQGYANPISLNNVTIAGNSAATTGGGIARTGTMSTGALNLTGTVVARNTATGGSPDISAAGTGPINANNSLVRDQTGITLTGTGNLPAGTDPLFVGGATPTLANNGGSVQTIALQSGSLMINAGTNGAVTGVDARGPGFSRTQGPSADIGAFEFAPTAGIPSALSTPTNVTTNGGTSLAFSVTYTDVAGTTVGMNTASFGNDDVTVTYTDSTGATILTAPATFVSNSGSTANYTVAVPGGTFDAADYGRARIDINAGAVTDLDGNAVPVGSAGSARILTPATFTVSTLADTGAGSLRDALAQANGRVNSADSIVFQAGLTGTINLASGLGILDSVSITGPGAGSLTVAGNNTFRLITAVMDGKGTLNMSGMTLTGGRTTLAAGGGALFASQETTVLDGMVVSANASTAGPGGGISAQRGSNLTIRNSTISGNMALGTTNSVGNGGGIGLISPANNSASNGSVVLIDNCVITGNTAGFSGGGISLRAGDFATIRNTTVSGNSAGASGAGGGVYFGYNGSTLVENCTISGNTCGFEGAGFYFYGHTDPRGITIRNSTISGNTSTGAGGGIGLQSFGFTPAPGLPISSSFVLQNSTVAGNTASSGGGFASLAPAGTNSFTVTSSVIAFNNAGSSPDFSGVATVDHSLIRDQTGATLTDAGGNLAAGTDPLFVGGATPTLANNGGPRQTIAIQSTSPLRNVGSNPAALTGDERGAVGFVRTFGAGTDIGAFEFQPQAAAIVNDGSAQRSRVTSLQVTFTAQVTFAGAVANAFTLTRVSDGAVVTFTATANTVNGVTVVTLSNFTGGATNNGSLADGRYTLTALSSQITIGGSALDGDGDGVAGGNFTFGDAQGLYRFFGDINGDRHVDIADFGVFSASIFNPANYLAAFDFNNDGVIDIADFGQFSLRIFTPLP
jgi:Right handed beta helix region